LNFFNGLLNIFSDLLLGPVIAGEILLLVWALIHAGDCHAEWLRRLRTSRGWKRFEDELTHGPADLVLEVDPPKGRYRPVAALCSARAANWRDEHLRHIVDGVEIQGRKSLEASTTMTRLGPMFGLMGTLIPMGPALKGLAGGDLETMSANLQVAFSTTVVGVFIGGIGFLCRQVRQRWAMEDLRLTEWMLSLGSAARKESESYAR
jgi:biopolymer transport protein ExbB/TolQ